MCIVQLFLEAFVCTEQTCRYAFRKGMERKDVQTPPMRSLFMSPPHEEDDFVLPSDSRGH